MKWESAAVAAKMEVDVQANVSSTETTEVGNVAPVGVAAPVSEAPGPQAGVASEVADGFIIHVRFRTDATIWMIDECPSHFTPQEWA
ncbi:hypothetical protein [Methylosinus trichosporium]|uniref:hypothetical protein n=1 Tax=Methylosinus trichosporium TaxID=426 RepID=UPI0024BA1478|nr:hypothetical protein [Methylosinus trichosporium]